MHPLTPLGQEHPDRVRLSASGVGAGVGQGCGCKWLESLERTLGWESEDFMQKSTM